MTPSPECPYPESIPVYGLLNQVEHVPSPQYAAWMEGHAKAGADVVHLKKLLADLYHYPQNQLAQQAAEAALKES